MNAMRLLAKLWNYRNFRIKNPEIGKCIDELEKNQWRSDYEIKELQWRKIKRLLRHSYESVPYYREAFDKMGIRVDDIQTPEDFRKIPILTKDNLRSNLNQLLAAGYDSQMLEFSATGGSTGIPTKYYHDDNYIAYRTALKARNYSWTGYRPGDYMFKIWGSSFDVKNASPGTSIKRFINQILYPTVIFPAFEISSSMIHQLIDDIWKKKPSVIEGYTTPMVFIGNYIINHNIDLAKAEIKGIVNAADTLHKHQREILEQAFRCRVYNKYGGRELSDVAMECDRGGFHVADDVVYFEIIREDGIPAREGEMGKIILTSLTNFCMPFIRYQIEDIAMPKNGACICGRGLSLISSIEGRIQDLIILKGGKFLAGEFFPHLFKDFDIEKYQVIQESLDLLNVYIIRGKNLSDDDVRYIKERINEYTGLRQIVFHFVESIPPSPSGKFRFTISKLENSFNE